MNKLLTLCLVIKDGKVLLGMKKRGFGAGRWNGFGGKVQEGESIEEAAIREMKEESDVSVTGLEEAGVLIFTFEGDPQPLEVHIFTTDAFGGEPHESEEMSPQWFEFDKVPYGEMWPDDRFWLPQVLAGWKVKGSFHFGEGDIILKKELEIL
ncbi:MAG TPA: 8-oxo-dGTP diphosphatase [Candidatus Paceibacterota bacterium]|nr:8-oxo-dGTP diphosphatase [Candidatus Paceibacterota bacterium]